MKEKAGQAPLKPVSWGPLISVRPLKTVLLASVLALLLVGHGFGAKWPNPPAGQPEQMQSRVDYDPKLSHPFFKSDEWSYWYGGQKAVSGMDPEGEDPVRLKHSAKCYSTSFGVKHRVRFCEAKLIDVNEIDLFINEFSPAFNDNLRVQVRNGKFTCQFWTWYKGGPQKGLTWTTKRQKLTLDKKAYRKGDVIKGRIEFECLEEPTDAKYIEKGGRHLTTIKAHGVFRTIVE